MHTIYKAVASDGATGMTFVLSDETPDSYGDIVEAAGWVLSRFKKNPIALFGHNSSFPIGTWENVRVEGTRLLADLKIAAAGTSYRLDEIRKLVEQKILRAASVGFRPLKEPERIEGGGYRFKRHELLETSLVAIPANPAALSLAKSLNISDDTLQLAFGEQAVSGQGGRPGVYGEKAKTPPIERPKAMTTLSDRVVAAQQKFVAARDAYNDHIAEEDFDVEASEALEANMKEAETRLDALKRAETNLASRTEERAPQAPAVSHKGRQKDFNGFDLLVRAVTAQGISHFGRQPLEQVLEQRYQNHEATAIIAKADQTIGTTGTAGWAAEVVQTVYADFLQALSGFSIYPALRGRGIALSFDGIGTVSIPSRTAGGAGGGFVAEGSPIRVGKITTAATTMTAKKMGVIIAFSRELAKRSTPAIEALVRQAILEDTSSILDPLLLDAVAADSARPAGLLNGVSAAAVGFGGGDYMAVVEDFKAMLAPFYAANAADNLTVIMNPAQGLNLAMMPGPDGVIGSFMGPLRERLTFIESTNATAGRLITIRNSDLATALGDTPEFDVSEQATIHMEDTTPLEIVSGTGPTTADPVRSLWQTASIGVRMIMDISWKMRRTGMVQWINGTSW